MRGESGDPGDTPQADNFRYLGTSVKSTHVLRAHLRTVRAETVRDPEGGAAEKVGRGLGLGLARERSLQGGEWRGGAAQGCPGSCHAWSSQDVPLGKLRESSRGADAKWAEGGQPPMTRREPRC